MNIIREFPLKDDMDLSRCHTEPIQLYDIPLLQCGGRFDKHIEPTRCTLKEIMECVEKPNITPTKEENMLWCFGECVDPERGHQKDNIVNKSKFFMVDYDNGYSIDEFCKEYKDYFYILYTSFSHTTEHNKFRVIMYGNYETPLNDDEQRFILNEAFRNADRTTLQPNRMFYMPAHKEGGEYVYKFNIGKQFPLYNDIISLLLQKQRLYRAKEESQNLIFEKYHREKKDIDCLKCKSVMNYLNTTYNKTSGNGDSNLNLYKAICCCVKYGDDKALDKVIAKAKSEKWTNKEIEQKIKSAKEKL